MSAATIEAKIDAELHAQRVEQAHEEIGTLAEYNRARAIKLLVEMGKASQTITRCAERMQTCKPQARFAYAAQITKAKRKFTWADNDLRRLS